MKNLLKFMVLSIAFLSFDNLAFGADECDSTNSCVSGKYCAINPTDGNTCFACPNFYTKSDANATAISQCYLTTSEGNYVAIAGAGQIQCPAGSYCIGGTNVYHSGSGTTTTGGSMGCPAPYINSTAGATAKTQCYLTTTEGYYVAIAGAGQTTCPTKFYCIGDTKVNYGGTGGSAQCTNSIPTGASYSGTGGTSSTCSWGITCQAGNYWSPKIKACAPCTKGWYCKEDRTISNTQSDKARGRYPCPAGKTTDGKGSINANQCKFVAGPNGTKFCDTNGCFTMPVGTVFN